MITGNFLLNTTITIQRRSSTKDSSGGQSSGGGYVAVTLLTNIPALIQPLSGRAQRVTAQRQVFVSHNIYLNAFYDILRGDRVYHPDTGKYFTVRGFEDMGGQGRVWRIECDLET